MRVGLFETKPTLRARHILECFAAGLRAHGDEPVWVTDYKSFKPLVRTCDVGVQVCYPNGSKGKNPQGSFRIDVNELMVELGRRVLTIDTGFVANQTEYELRVAKAAGRYDQVLFDMDRPETYKHVLRDIYYETGYDGLKRNADYCVGKKGDDASRWRVLEKRFGARLAPWRKGGKHVLLVGQTLQGLSSQHVNIYQWYKETIAKVRKHTDREIVFRPHPRIAKIRTSGSRIGKDKQAFDRVVGQTRNFRRTQNFLLEDDLKDAWAVVTFTSNAAVTAALAGVPVFAADPANMAWEVANHDLGQIDKPRQPERSGWAHRLAWSQFNCAEMADGTCWAHLRPHAQKPARHALEWRRSKG
jgi:hypothetical protein